MPRPKNNKTLLNLLTILLSLALLAVLILLRTGRIQLGGPPLSASDEGLAVPAVAGVRAPDATPCPHAHWVDGVCADCGEICSHARWQDGLCVRCGTPCPHPKWENGSCVFCGLTCTHETWEDGSCAVCGFACDHAQWEDGICTRCGFACPHEDWKDGVCTVCSYVCPHPEHDEKSRHCLDCGQLVIHHYVNGVCSCGATPVLYSDALPDRYYEPCEHAGTIVDWNFQTDSNLGQITRRSKIYLPYGYDPDKPYNVLLLYHGTGDMEDGWLTANHWIANRDTQGRYVVDHMIDEGLIEPLIIVTPTFYAVTSAGGTVDLGVNEMAEEIREIILPYLVENYSTYAASSSYNDLVAARAHFGMGGLSWGSYYTYAAGMRLNLSILSNFICMSGSDDPDVVQATINSPDLLGYDIDLYYSACGTGDGGHGGGIQGFEHIVYYTDRLTEGQNAFLHDTVGGHEWLVWITELFNSLQYAFPAR
ncbi:MAG: hypothetical protein J5927_03625 [Oscillospiraceae bacterium]|nr:hypothetical protein [Oscillospiraceae bacterium]